VKLACSSSAFRVAIDSGDLTQLEFLDHAARALECDGVALDTRQFPRTDGDYLAQVKKMTVDLGLDIAAVADDEFFSGTQSHMSATLELTLALGAPVLAGRLAPETAFSWSEQLAKLNDATGLAKRANVTLAVRNAAGTFAATTLDCKRVSKEADSAWLRFGPAPAEFDAASDPASVVPKTVLLWRSEDKTPDVAGWETFRGYVTLDRADGACTIADMQSAMRRWHIARANLELNRT
jgi:hypothetical protein